MKSKPWDQFGFRFVRSLLRMRNRYFFALDVVASVVALVLGVWIRTESFGLLLEFPEAFALYTVVAILIRIAVFIPFGLYARLWRYASIDELLQIFLAVLTATTINALVYFGVLRQYRLVPSDLPRSLPILEGVFFLIAVGAIRFSVRLIGRMQHRRFDRGWGNKQVIILGAGDAGVMIAREMLANPQLGLEPVAFLDDASDKQGNSIHGVRVLGECARVGEIAKRTQARQAIIAMPTASGLTVRHLVRLCQESGLPVKTVPGIFELLDGSVTVNQLREVDIVDLLRREPVATDLALVVQLVQNKRVLVTGAGGSIGSELCRQIAHARPALLMLLGHGENSIFAIANELHRTHPQLALAPVIADVRDRDRLQSVFENHRPDVVFHAAAHKHVPLMEQNPEDAITNNVLGTRNVTQMASAFAVAHLVLISTDKAVNPINVMGATKRLAELIVQRAAAETGRCFVVVRFGNVLGSRGSVVPLFKEQIKRGGPITITHPEICRYFMTIPEAAQLVLQAAAFGKGGQVFVLNMGEQIRIVDLARDLIRLSGLVEGQDIEIVFTGLRPGEKLSEELNSAVEVLTGTAHQKIMRVQINGAGATVANDFTGCVDALIEQARQGNMPRARALLQSILPEYAAAAHASPAG